jgi:hypothetical protein
MRKLDILMVILGILCLITLGWVSNDMYRDYTNKKMFNGLYFEMNNSQEQALTQAYKFERDANWVCVNVKGMEFKEAIKTCNHEVAHEVFATYCQDHIDKCLEVTK